MNYQRLVELLALTKDLQTDLLQHPSYYFECVRAAAQASAHVDECKNDLERVEADINIQVRTAAANSGEKVTEALVASWVKTNKQVMEAQRQYLDARNANADLQALAKAYEARGHILHDLTLLATKGVDSAGISSYSDLRQRTAEARRPLVKKG